MPSPTDEIMISLGFDFAALSEAKREQLIPGLGDSIGYVEAFSFLADCVDHFMAAVLKEYPGMISPDGVHFYDDYHTAKFSHGGVLAYDASRAILEELTDNPVDLGGMAECQRIGTSAYQRLKTDPTPTDVTVVDHIIHLLNA